MGMEFIDNGQVSNRVWILEARPENGYWIIAYFGQN